MLDNHGSFMLYKPHFWSLINPIQDDGFGNAVQIESGSESDMNAMYFIYPSAWY